MPIRPPRLDDRSYDDLLEELLARVPAHTPEWRPDEIGDPGRTLLELFAWLADTVLYRANLVPERQRLAFLRLLGMPLRPARPARGLVTLAFDGAQAPLTVAAGSTVTGPLPFETRDEITVLPLVGECYHKRRLSDAEREAMADTIDELRAFYGIDGEVESYVTTPLFQDGPEPFDLAARSVDASLWIALLAPPRSDPEAIRARLADPDQPRLLNVGLDPALEPGAGIEAVADGTPQPLRWSLSTAELDDDGNPRYRPLRMARDGSEGLTRRGAVRLELPGRADLFGVVEGDARRESNAGVGDRPPRLDDPERLARLVAWLRLRPGAGAATLRLRWAAINAVEIDQRRSTRQRLVGQSDGGPDQRFELGAGAVDPATLRIEVEERGRGFVAWRQVEELAEAGPDENVFQLDPEAGEIRFGDGIRGRVPEAGARIKVAFMRAGGGAAGNLPPGSLGGIEALAPDGRRIEARLVVRQALPTRGGADAETLEEAERRIPARLRHRERAVTADDYRDLARETPGTPLGRVEVLPRFLPRQRREDVPGVVSVMVLPPKAALAPPNPRPDAATIRRVHAHLAPRKPLAAELYVIGCEYLPLALGVGIAVRPGFSPEAVAAGVEAALRRHLWPLAPHGPHGEGWPLGRAVGDRELEVVAARVEGVAEVAGVDLYRPRAGGGWRAVARPDPCAAVELRLEDWQLPELLAVTVATGGRRPESIDEAAPSAATGAGGVVAIPLVPEVC